MTNIRKCIFKELRPKNTVTSIYDDLTHMYSAGAIEIAQNLSSIVARHTIIPVGLVQATIREELTDG